MAAGIYGMLENLKDEYGTLIGWAVLGLLSSIGYLARHVWLPSRPKNPTPQENGVSVSQREFTDGLAVLRAQIAEVAKDASSAKAMSTANALALVNITDLLKESMADFATRFEKVADRMDNTVDKIVGRIDNHESRISKTEAKNEERLVLAQTIFDRLERLEDKK